MGRSGLLAGLKSEVPETAGLAGAEMLTHPCGKASRGGAGEGAQSDTQSSEQPSPLRGATAFHNQ